MTRAMQISLPLVEDEAAALSAEDDWRLDDRTREAGRRGLAEARAALAAAALRAAQRDAEARRHPAAA